MLKKSTNNTFDKGLLMDFNPIVTPNNVLTNCLNGTIITFNGNEYALQNDMGNGRVETAYLPEGYIPMGTAELGGIIYIVSYNPLTDRCQIGSFPSPERNISSDELNIPVKELNRNQLVDSNGNILQTLLKISLLSDEDIKLSSGDQFSIYTETGNIINNKNRLSSIFPTEEMPEIGKNLKYVTIHIVSVSSNGEITYLDDTLKWYNINSENGNFKYYIQDGVKSEDTDQIDIDAYRSLVQSAYHVFQSKFNGDLALLIEVETINNFQCSYSLESNSYVYDEEKSYESTDIQTYLSQCNRDYTISLEVNYQSNASNINIKGLRANNFTVNKDLVIGYENQQGEIKYIYLKKDEQNDLTLHWIDQDDNSQFTNRKNDGSDSAVQFILLHLYENSSLNDAIISFDITPAMPFGYLISSTQNIVINLSLIGTGSFVLQRYRYYTGPDTLTLDIGFDIYPEVNRKVTEVSIHFTSLDTIATDFSVPQGQVLPSYIEDITTSRFPFIFKRNTYTLPSRSSYSGNYSIELNLNSQLPNIIPNTLYLITFYFVYEHINNPDDVKYARICRWLHTTGVFNQEFLNQKEYDFSILSLDKAYEGQFTGNVTYNNDSLYLNKITPTEIDLSSNTFSSIKNSNAYQLWTFNFKNGALPEFTEDNNAAIIQTKLQFQSDEFIYNVSNFNSDYHIELGDSSVISFYTKSETISDSITDDSTYTKYLEIKPTLLDQTDNINSEVDPRSVQSKITTPNTFLVNVGSRSGDDNSSVLQIKCFTQGDTLMVKILGYLQIGVGAFLSKKQMQATNCYRCFLYSVDDLAPLGLSYVTDNGHTSIIPLSYIIETHGEFIASSGQPGGAGDPFRFHFIKMENLKDKFNTASLNGDVTESGGFGSLGTQISKFESSGWNPGDHWGYNRLLDCAPFVDYVFPNFNTQKGCLGYMLFYGLAVRDGGWCSPWQQGSARYRLQFDINNESTAGVDLVRKIAMFARLNNNTYTIIDNISSVPNTYGNDTNTYYKLMLESIGEQTFKLYSTLYYKDTSNTIYDIYTIDKIYQAWSNVSDTNNILEINIPYVSNLIIRDYQKNWPLKSTIFYDNIYFKGSDKKYYRLISGPGNDTNTNRKYNLLYSNDEGQYVPIRGIPIGSKKYIYGEDKTINIKGVEYQYTALAPNISKEKHSWLASDSTLQVSIEEFQEYRTTDSFKLQYQVDLSYLVDLFKLSSVTSNSTFIINPKFKTGLVVKNVPSEADMYVYDYMKNELLPFTASNCKRASCLMPPYEIVDNKLSSSSMYYYTSKDENQLYQSLQYHNGTLLFDASTAYYLQTGMQFQTASKDNDGKSAGFYSVSNLSLPT